MNYYETLLIVRQEATTSQVETAADELVALIEEKGGKIARREYWGLRTLAYRIRKSRKGHYVLLNYESPSDAVDAIQHSMRYSDDVVRYMTIRTEDLPTDASVQMRAEEETDTDKDDDGKAKVAKPKKDKGLRPRRAAAPDDEEEEEEEVETESESPESETPDDKE